MAYKFAVNEIAPISFDCDKEEKYTPDIRKKAAQQGLVAAWVPEAYRGAGVGIMGNAKLSLAYENLKVIKPEIIYCSLTGYGQDGPMATRAGHDINYIARLGIASYSGKKEQCPSLMGMQIADVASGSNNAIIGILAAVISRNATEKGQSIDISMTDAMIAFNTILAPPIW